MFVKRLGLCAPTMGGGGPKGMPERHCLKGDWGSEARFMGSYPVRQWDIG